MSERDPEQLHSELERQAEDLERQADKLAKEISDARDDWERKRRDQSVAGAPPPEQESDRNEDEGEQMSEDTPPAKD